MSQRLLEEDFDVHFIHLDDVDHAGHATGFDPDNPAYIEAVESVDEDVGALVDAILARPTVTGEDWLIVFTTDHGGAGTSHGALDRANRRIPLQITGAGVRPELGGGQPSHLDVFPTVMAWLGQPARPDLDGHARAIDFEASCSDGVDDDGDGRSDCDDPDCAPICAPVCPDAADELGGRTGEAVVEANTDGAGNLGGASCGGQGGPEVAFAWRAPATDVYAFHTIGADFDTILYLLDDDCAELACNDHLYGTWRRDVPIGAESGFWAALEADQRVRIVVDGAGSGTAPLAIHPRTETCGAAVDLADATGPAVAEDTNVDAPTRLQLPCAGAGRDQLYRWRAPAAGRYVFDTVGSDFDTVLAITGADCAETLACSDDAEGLQSRVEIDLEADQEVRVVISGFRGRDGTFRLNITAP